MELLFNLNNPEVTAKHIYDVMLLSWKSGCKTVYYVRTIQKDGNISDKEECVSCSG
jgi:ribonucleoside-diphosphate reductase alpha chain